MHPVRTWWLPATVLLAAACGGSEGAPSAKCASESTFGQVQSQIFEARGCTRSSCHGESPQSGLDLRADVAYQNLINVDSVSGDFKRVFPTEEELSVLFGELGPGQGEVWIKLHRLL